MNLFSFISLRLALILYFILWIMALPFLSVLSRLKISHAHRFGLRLPRGEFDLWIQAASVGEARLTIKFLQKIPQQKLSRIVVSTNTPQAMEILKQEKDCQGIQLIYFPLDFVFLLPGFFRRFRPGKVLLMETEIWPGLLFKCQRKKIPVCIGNARMSLKSFCRYSALGNFFSLVGPDEIMAVSSRDAFRFQKIFKRSRVGQMNNIKYDMLQEKRNESCDPSTLPLQLGKDHRLIVLGSTRQEEESLMQWLIKNIRCYHPEIILALFPRHMHRLQFWEKFFQKNGMDWTRRSALSRDQKQAAGIILWDTFGELKQVYSLAASVYVGGSLIPCGGQNFLEPVSQGVVPCVGPFRDNFRWIEDRIFE
ncbi:MAG: 3-deoxy-D-manno-octulosonic acid transferase, partial [Desulfonatronovibrionaceae bacterium]